MIRWDPAGEHIIVEKPEQLALHVLPSVYRQSRFASFSRQLNVSRPLLCCRASLLASASPTRPHLAHTHTHSCRFMASCARSTSATSTPPSTTQTPARGVSPVIPSFVHPRLTNCVRVCALYLLLVAHPTLNRHSPPEVVANFKRRVPPRLPKPRKRDANSDVPTIPPPRSAVGMGPVPLSVPSGPGSPGRRARGFSAPGSFTPLSQPNAPGWATASYPRQPLPPLTVPDTHPSSLSAHGHNGMYGHGHPLTPSDEPPSSTTAFTPLSSYSSGTSAGSGREMLLPSPSSAYPYSEQNAWSFSPAGTASSHSSGSLSSLLNPNTTAGAGGYGSRPSTGLTSYGSGYGISTMSRTHHGGAASPDSRPATGYSMSSVSSLSTPYDETAPHHFGHGEYSRPGSSHRPLTPASSRPPSSKAPYGGPGSLSVRRDRRHSHAMSPYPSPYSEHPPQSAGSERPSTSPHPGSEDHSVLPRVRSMMNMGSVDAYGFNPAQAEFAYAAVDDHQTSHHNGHSNGLYGRAVRPSTSTSSLSGNSSAANTPAGDFGAAAGADSADINRCE